MILDIFDKESGAKIRAALGVLMAIATALLAVLQAAAGALEGLPDWEQVGSIAMFIQGTIIFLGRFLALGNKVAG